MTVLKTERARLWRYGVAVALVFMPLLWAFFGAMLALLHRLTGWPDGEALRILAPTALIASLVPVALPVVEAGAQRDGLIRFPNASGSPAQGHFAAFVIWPGRDFHWYRRDSNDMWSHKPGQTPSRDVDESGVSISDPMACNRGPYTDFCGYMNVIPERVQIL